MPKNSGWAARLAATGLAAGNEGGGGGEVQKTANRGKAILQSHQMISWNSNTFGKILPQGYTEFGFMSTTADRSGAKQYSGVKDKKPQASIMNH